MALGINDYVVVIVINAISTGKKSTNYFDRTTTMLSAARRAIQESMGNQHANTDIQKQAYPFDQAKTVRSAFGLTGTNFGTHKPYINGRQVLLNSPLVKGAEIVLVKNGLDVAEALEIANNHKILPQRTNSTLTRQLSGLVPPEPPTPPRITYEVLGTGEEPGPIFGPGNAGQPGQYGDFGGLGIFDE